MRKWAFLNGTKLVCSFRRSAFKGPVYLRQDVMPDMHRATTSEVLKCGCWKGENCKCCSASLGMWSRWSLSYHSKWSHEIENTLPEQPQLSCQNNVLTHQDFQGIDFGHNFRISTSEGNTSSQLHLTWTTPHFTSSTWFRSVIFGISWSKAFWHTSVRARLSNRNTSRSKVWDETRWNTMKHWSLSRTHTLENVFERCTMPWIGQVSHKIRNQGTWSVYSSKSWKQSAEL